MNAAHSSFLLHEELRYFRNFTDLEASLIDHETTSEISMVFTIGLLTLSSLGILTTLLLLFGLYRDCKLMLIPWICNLVAFIVADFTYVIYILIVHALQWNPPAAIMITVDFFLNSLHVYSLLCVISQYQELKAGRGRALDDQLLRMPNVHYSSQPTATSYMSSRRPVTYYETKPTPTQSPTGAPSPATIPDILSPSPGLRRGSKKSVKFPDSASLTPHHNGSQLLDPWSIEVKSPMMVTKGFDMAPLIDSGLVTVTQSSV